MKFLAPLLHLVGLAIATTLTLIAIIVIDSSFGFPEFLGVTGLSDLLIVGLIITGSISYITTKYLINFEKSDYYKLEIHLFHTVILYLILMILTYNILSTQISGGLDEAYKLATIVILIIYITANALTIFWIDKTKKY